MAIRKLFQITDGNDAEIELSVLDDNIVVTTTDETATTVANLIFDDAYELGRWLQEVSQ